MHLLSSRHLRRRGSLWFVCHICFSSRISSVPVLASLCLLQPLAHTLSSPSLSLCALAEFDVRYAKVTEADEG